MCVNVCECVGGWVGAYVARPKGEVGSSTPTIMILHELFGLVRGHARGCVCAYSWIEFREWLRAARGPQWRTSFYWKPV